MQPHDATAQSVSPERSKAWPRRWLGRLLWAPFDLYALAGLGYLTLKIALGDRFWPVALVDNVAFWLMLPSLPLLALAAWRRRWRSAAPLAVIAAGFLWLFGGLFAPRFVPTLACASPGDGCSIRLRVMTFNMFNDLSDTARALDEIRRSDADVVALVEYTKSRASAVETALGDEYPYRVQYGDGIPGIGLISKYPIHDAQNLRLDSQRMLSHVQATVEIEGQTLTVFVAHPDPPTVRPGSPFPYYVVRGSDAIAELSRRASSGGPALLMGDFNMADITDDYRVVSGTGLIDSFREAGYGLGVTWPAPHLGHHARPLIRIDYIWHTRHFTATHAWVGGETSSDHLPVIADLVWERQ